MTHFINNHVIIEWLLRKLKSWTTQNSSLKPTIKCPTRNLINQIFSEIAKQFTSQQVNKITLTRGQKFELSRLFDTKEMILAWILKSFTIYKHFHFSRKT